MSEQLIISGGEKNDKYQTLLQQLPALIDEQVDNVANMSNLVAALNVHYRCRQGYFSARF